MYTHQNYSLTAGGVSAAQPEPYDGGLEYAKGSTVRSIKFVRTPREGQEPAYAPLRTTRRTVSVGFGDMNGDGYTDLITRDQAGRLWLSSGADGTGTLIGTGGWNAMTGLVGAGDVNGDGRNDLIALGDVPVGSGADQLGVGRAHQGTPTGGLAGYTGLSADWWGLNGIY